MNSNIEKSIQDYNNSLPNQHQLTANNLAQIIQENLPDSESKIWHAHPVWFLEGNPIVGYSLLKSGLRLMFWSGADFDQAKLLPGSGKFKDASTTYTSIDQIDTNDLNRWLQKAREIQWDYKNLVKRKGVLERLK